MPWNVPAVRRLMAVALLAWAGVRGVGGEPPRSESALAAQRCILCSSFGASHVPRICTTCNNKHSNRCVLCNAFGPAHMPRICTTCNNKFSNKCILCNAFSPKHTPRICTTCNNKF